MWFVLVFVLWGVPPEIRDMSQALDMPKLYPTAALCADAGMKQASDLANPSVAAISFRCVAVSNPLTARRP